MQNRTGLSLLFSSKSFLFYWLASTLSMISSNIIQFILALYVLNNTGSATVFASILSIIIIPRIALTPLAGVVGDRYARIKIICVIQLLSSALLALFVVVSYVQNGLSIFLIYILVVLLEAIEVFYQAAARAIIPEIVDKSLIEEAVASSKFYEGIVFTITPILGAVIYKAYALTGGLFFAMLFFIFSTILMFMVKATIMTDVKKVECEQKPNGTYFSDFKLGIRQIKSNEFLRRFIFITPLLNFFFTSIFSVTIPYLLMSEYKVGEYIYGIYNSISVSAVLIVPFFAMKFVKKHKTNELIAFSSLFVSLSLMLIGCTVFLTEIFEIRQKIVIVFIIAAIDFFVISIMMPTHMSISVLYQKTISDAYRSRVLSISRMINMVSIPIGSLFYGFLADNIPLYYSLFISFAGVLLCNRLYKFTFKNYIQV